MIIALSVLLVLAALYFTLGIRDKHLRPVESEQPIKPLEEAKARIYESLRDLQFEYRVGKLSDEDYQQTKLELQKELARVLAQMDTAGATAAAELKEPAADGKTCPHCGAQFPQKLKFCGACGKPMGGAA